MYLKGIELQGFKSFADKINLEFGQGVTAIVGPNGSGKSNVSDAIRWVLGEQSVKSLRGSKMEDVIFAGTQKRSPMGFAQVSIILDNKDKIFNIDYKEVKVTRKLHRSGESDYYINNNSCRLKDIHELFMDTGLGREGYSVIGQGKIDQILSTKAEERRNIFEEASGITKFKYRKAEAEKKLLQADENLVRIKDLISAMEDQLAPLKTQSEKAKKYLDLRERLKGLDINIAIRNIDKQRALLEKAKKDYTIVFNHLNDEKNKILQTEKAIEINGRQNESLNELINNLKEQVFAIEKNSGDLLNKTEILLNDIKNNSENIERLQNEIKETDEKNAITDGEIEKIKKEIESKKESADKINEKLKSRDDEKKNADEKINETVKQIDELKNRNVNLLSDISALKARMSSLDVLLKNFDDRSDAISDDLKKKQNNILQTQKMLDGEMQNRENNKIEYQNAVDSLKKLKDEYFKVTKQLDDAKLSQNACVSKLNEKESRKKILEELEKNYEGFSKSVKKVIEANFDGVHGVVSKLIQVDDKYVTAIETALGNMLQNVVTDNEQTAKKCINFLKSNNYGRATFLPITSVKGDILKNAPTGEKGYIGIASELIRYDGKYSDIFASLLGRCAIADNLDNAVSIAKKNNYKFKIVTLDGQQINPGGSLTGGSSGARHGILSRAKDIDGLKSEIASIQKQVDKNDDIIVSFKQTINKMAQQKEQFDSTVNKCEREAVRINTAISSYEKSADELKKSIESLTDENGGIVNEIADVANQKQKLKENIINNENLIREIREQLNEKQSMQAYLEECAQKIADSEVNDRIEYNSYRKDIEMLNSRLETYLESIEQNKADIERKKQNAQNLAALNEGLNKEIEDINGQISATKQDKAQISDEAEQKIKMYNEGLNEQKNLQKQLKEQNETVYVLQQEAAKLENRNSKTEYDIESIINRMWEDYELTYNTALEYKKEVFDMAESTREASALKNEIKSLGNINVDAIEQYKEVKEKFDYMSTQKADLDETKTKLEDIINELQSVMVKQFTESFAQIKTKFDSVFRQLFGGGIGKLSLTEPDNVLESGIDIEVQPPGKKLQNMMALSGGERALSAIALLFSVLEVRPTPFCILDEVEAALDDNNVYRFAEYIRKYSNKTQFIVVTHRRGTMEAADIMYGVTMQERGVSKLLKLKFEDLEEYTSDGN